MHQHTLYTNKDADRPDVICDSNGSVVLSLCKVCGRAEAELEGECPGSPVPDGDYSECHGFAPPEACGE